MRVTPAALKGGARWVAPLICPLGLVLVVGLLAEGSSPDLSRTVVGGLTNLVIVVALYVFIGNSGVLSFGHAGLVAVGAYASAVLTINPALKRVLLPSMPTPLQSAQFDTLPAFAVAAALSALVALVVGVVLMRLSGLPAAIGTFGLLLVVQSITSNAESITAGPGTLLGIPRTSTLELALSVALVTIVVAYVFQRSSVALRLRASREDEVAAVASGVDVHRDRLIAFVLSGAIAGVGGALYSHILGSISPDAFGLDLTLLTLTMLIVGGMRSLSGAVYGSALVSALSEVLFRIENGIPVLGIAVKGPSGLRELGLAVVLIAILLLRPQGLTGGREMPDLERLIPRLSRGARRLAPRAVGGVRHRRRVAGDPHDAAIDDGLRR